MTQHWSQPRLTRRISCHAAAVLTTRAGAYPCMCQNLSLGGAFLACPSQPEGDVVSLRVCLPSLGPVELDGKILYRNLAGCGVRFQNMAATALAVLRAFLGGLLEGDFSPADPGRGSPLAR
jgi:hypothetical protein